ncbi:MAG: S1C family serine protease [Acidimicrobiia bacterium]|nr:S1C family serine protease [Acidimicrobiia bacterium]
MPAADDRLWRHPSELGAATTRSRLDALRQSLGVAAASALGGGMIVAGLWLALGSTGNPQLSSAFELDDEPPSSVLSPIRSIESTGRDGFAATIVRIESTDGEATGVGFALGDGLGVITGVDAVADMNTATVLLPDGERVDATVTGRDRLTGVAGLRLDSGSITAAPSGADAPVTVTGRVVAHTPDGTVAGALSDAMVIVETGGPWNHVVFELRVEDPIASGTPVVDAGGRLVGMVTDVDGVHADMTPIAVVRRVGSELLGSGSVSHPWLGVEARDATDGEVAGALVTLVEVDGPASDSGLTVDDIVTGVEGRSVTSIAELINELRRHPVGHQVSIDVSGPNGTRTVQVELGLLGG